MLNINTNTCEFFFLEYEAIIILKFHWTCCLPLRFKWQKTLRINSTIIHMKKYQNFHQYPVNTDTYGNMLTLTFSLFHCNSRSQTGRESDVGHVIWRRCCHLAREVTPLPLYGQRGREAGSRNLSRNITIFILCLLMLFLINLFLNSSTCLNVFQRKIKWIGGFQRVK